MADQSKLNEELLDATRRSSPDPAEVEAALANGADVACRDGGGETPLMYAARNDESGAVVQRLVDANSPLNAKNKYGWTALISASFNNNPEAVRVLVAAGADTSLRSNDGKTAEDDARQYGYTDIVALLQAPAPAASTAGNRLAVAQRQAEAQRQADAEAQRLAEAERQVKAKADAEAKRLADAEAQRLAEAKRLAEAQRQAKADAEAKRQAKADAQAQRLADAEAQRQAKADADAETKRRAAAEKLEAVEARRAAKAEAQRAADAAKQQAAEAKAQRAADAEAKRAADAAKQRAAELEAGRVAAAKTDAELNEHPIQAWGRDHVHHYLTHHVQTTAAQRLAALKLDGPDLVKLDITTALTKTGIGIKDSGELARHIGDKIKADAAMSAAQAEAMAAAKLDAQQRLSRTPPEEWTEDDVFLFLTAVMGLPAAAEHNKTKEHDGFIFLEALKAAPVDAKLSRDDVRRVRSALKTLDNFSDETKLARRSSLFGLLPAFGFLQCVSDPSTDGSQPGSSPTLTWRQRWSSKSSKMASASGSGSGASTDSVVVRTASFGKECQNQGFVKASTEVLGSGSFSCVYKVRKNKTEYAMKRVPLSLVADGESETKVARREYNLIKSLSQGKEFGSRFIINPVCEPFVDDGILCIVSGLYKASLFDVLEEADPKTNTWLSTSVRVSIAAKLVLGLAHVHNKEVTHRDIKSMNVLVSLSADRMDADCVLADFGMAVIDHSHGRRSKQSSGKGLKYDRIYDAPEVLLGKQPTFKSDVWSLGLVLLELIVGTSIDDEDMDALRDVAEHAVDSVLNRIYKESDFGVSPAEKSLKEAVRKMLIWKTEDRADIQLILLEPFVLAITGELESADIRAVERQKRTSARRSGKLSKKKNSKVSLVQIMAGDRRQLKLSNNEVNTHILEMIFEYLQKISKTTTQTYANQIGVTT